jgi:DNA-binding beta-propeller fold protein YncE
VRACLIAAFGVLAAVLATGASGRPTGGTPIALVTAETENDLLAVSLPPRRILARVHVPADPQNVAALDGSAVVVVSAESHAVTVLTPSLKVVRIFRSFRSPHLVAIGFDGKHAYVTDDGTGSLVVIDLTQPEITARIRVGLGAHHLAFSPDGNKLWIALGEHARAIVELDTTRPARPRVVGRFDPGFVAHDLGFSPDDRHVWVTSDSDSRVRVFSSASHRLLFSVPVGPPPQHVAFGPRGEAYLTSGYGSRLVSASPTGRVLHVANVPYGSFNVVTAGGLVVTSSLLRGTLTELSSQLHVVATLKVAPAARGVAVAVR